MKKLLAVLSFAVMFSNFLPGEDKAFPEKPTMSQILNVPQTRGKDNSVRSLRLIYKVSDLEYGKCSLMIRAKTDCKVRLDVASGKQIYSAGRENAGFWTYAEGYGFQDMQEPGSDLLLQYIALLVLPGNQNPIFQDPVFKREEVVNNVKRSVFEVRPVKGSEIMYELSVENKTHDLRRVKLFIDGRPAFVVLYRNYRMYNGQKLARNISTSNPYGSYQMTLTAADWNLDIPDSVFQKDTKIMDSDLSFVLKKPGNESEPVEKVQKVGKPEKSRVEILERKINKLKLEIAYLEKDLRRKEDVAQSSQARAASTENLSVGFLSGCNSYRRRGRGGRSRRNYFAQWAQAAEAGSAAKHSNAVYEKACKELLNKRMELSDAEYELKKLTGK